MRALFARVMALISGALREIFTGADNETLAWGKVIAALYLPVGWALPYVMLKTHQAFSLAEAGVFLTTHAAGVWPLIRGTAPTEPSAAPAEAPGP